MSCDNIRAKYINIYCNADDRALTADAKDFSNYSNN